MNSAETLLADLERRVKALEGQANSSSTPAVVNDEALLQENSELKATNARLEYRIAILLNSLQEVEDLVKA